MAYGRRVAFEPIRTAAFGAIGAAYAAVGTATTDYTRIVSFFNDTDADVYASIDGVNDHVRINAGCAQVFDLTANRENDDGLFLSENTTFYAKRVAGAPTTGSFWIQVMVASGGV